MAKYEGDPRFSDLLDILAEMHSRKAQDYGAQADPLANLRASKALGIPPWKGALLRMNDKLTRLNNFALRGTLANESFQDSLLDIAAYGLLTHILYMEETAPPSEECSNEGHISQAAVGDPAHVWGQAD